MSKKIVFNISMPAHLCLQEVEHLLAFWQNKQARMHGFNIDDGQIQARVDELRELQFALNERERAEYPECFKDDLTTQFNSITRRV